jgi:hypothetical protein
VGALVIAATKMERMHWGGLGSGGLTSVGTIFIERGLAKGGKCSRNG